MQKAILHVLAYWVAISAMVPPTSAGGADPDLAGWWKFDERRGKTTVDASGNGYDGTLIGPVEWATSWDGSGALEFTGTDNYVRVEDGPKLNPTSEITLVAWLNPNWTGNNRILQKEPDDRQYRLLKEWQDHLVFEIATVGRLQHGGIPPSREWTHVAATYDGSFLRIYYNAEEVDAVRATGKIPASTAPLIIGSKRPGAVAGDEYSGLMDDVRIYSRALSSAEITSLTYRDPRAYEPDPPDGATTVGSPLIIWNAGRTATYHDVYFGTDPKPTRDQYQGRQVGTVFCPDLRPQTTYYWRIDEIEGDKKVVHAGDVWTFTTEPPMAHGPNPPDQMRWIDPNHVRLTWSPGADAVAHEVYFGASRGEVAGGQRGAVTSRGNHSEPYCEIGSLESNRTYFWRVDEIDSVGARRVGSIWSFTTAEPGGGIRGEYFGNLTLQGAPVCMRTDREINFMWRENPPAPGVPVHGFSVRWRGVVSAPFASTYTFYTTVKGGVRLWIDGKLLIDRWLPHLLILDYEAEIPLEAGIHPITMEWADMQYESEGGVAQLYWESPGMSKRILAAGPLQPLTENVVPKEQ